MANDNQTDDDRELTVEHKREVIQKESLTVKSKRGSGTNDRDEVRKFVEREVELDVPQGLLDQCPTLIGEEESAKAVADAATAMAQLRETNQDDE